MTKKEPVTSSAVQALLKPLELFDNDLDYYEMLKKISAFAESLDEQKRQEFNDLRNLVEGYIRFSRNRSHHEGFINGMKAAEKQKK